MVFVSLSPVKGNVPNAIDLPQMKRGRERVNGRLVRQEPKCQYEANDGRRTYMYVCAMCWKVSD